VGRKRRYFTAERREAYLDCLRVTASHKAAAREAGVSERAARRYRARKPEFETACGEAESEARRRLAGAEGPFDGPMNPAFESIRRGPKGEAKIVKTPGGRWTIKTEERFFAVLEATGNIAASARAVGFSREAIGKRRRKWPAFARRVEEMMEEAEVDLEFRLLCEGSGWSEAAEARREAADAEPAPPLNPEFVLKFLKWREEKRRGKSGAGVALPDADKVRERIVAKVVAVKRHREAMARRNRDSEGEC
jgi:hypothetical protein